MTAQSGQSFFLLSVLLLSIFVAAIILGGSLLTWQAHRNMVSAQQKTSFVSNVSHELKTPLTSIRMFAELLQEDRIKDPAKKGHYLKVIVAESQRLTRLVNNVLDFSRLEQGRKQYQLKELELSGYLRYIVETQRLRVQEAGMVLDNKIPEAEYTVHTDEDAIEQVLLNLLDNAIKYAAEGKELTVDLVAQDDHVKVSVMDRGPGVPAKHRTRIFEKFHRVDSSLTSRHPGSGLGLSIARTIMRDLNGDLLYEPRDGGGSCFSVLIPFRQGNGSHISKKGAASA
jgi:signal transduction histidine kinase